MEKSSEDENLHSEGLTTEGVSPHQPLLPITITFNAELIDEFKCPICLDIMQNVMVTWCLHRFCKACIEKHLRCLGNNRDCPSCRVRIKSKRDLRNDVRMDALIFTVFGKIERMDEQEDSPPHKRHKENPEDNSEDEEDE